MKILRKIKSGWTAIMGFATWVLVVVSSFMMEPPQRSYFEENNSPEVSKFIIAALTAILLVQILRRSRKKEYKYWYRISIGSLIFGLAIFSCYKFMADRFSVNFYDTKIVTGDTMFPSMKHRKDSLELAKKIHITDSDFVKMCQGKVESIWPEEQLSKRFYLLNLCYIVSTVIIGIFIICVIQAISCYQQKE